MATATDTVIVEDGDDEVVLVRVNTAVVDLTSDISSDEESDPTVTVVPKSKIEARIKTQNVTPSNSKTSSRPMKRIKHTIINMGAIVVPFIFRGQQQLVEKNLVEELLFFKYFRIFSDELIQCMTPVLFMLTPEEKTYFANLHKQFNCTGAVSNILFGKEDVEKMLDFLKNCYEMLVLNKPKFSICGFVKILGTLIPFIMHNWFKFMPLFYFENDSELGKKLSKVSATFSNPWVLSYLKMCCKIEGVREQFYLKTQLKLVNLNSLVKNLPDGTRVDIYWPEKVNELLFRPDYLRYVKTEKKGADSVVDFQFQSKKRKQEVFDNSAKKNKLNSPTEQRLLEPDNSFFNDIKVTIENVMTVPEDSFDDEDSEFTESSKNQNVIVIRANDTVPIQMSLNVGPVKSSQTSVNMDEVLASHSQMLFNPYLHSEAKLKNDKKKLPVVFNSRTKLTSENQTLFCSKEDLTKRNDNKIITEFTSSASITPTIGSDSPMTTTIKHISTSRELLETTNKILNLAEPLIKPEVKSEKFSEITLDDIQDDDDNEGTTEFTVSSAAQSVVSIGSSTCGDLTDFDQAITPVSLVVVKPDPKYIIPKMQIVTSAPQEETSAYVNESSTLSGSGFLKAKNNLKTSVFSSPVTTLNDQAEPYPLCFMEEPGSKQLLPPSSTTAPVQVDSNLPTINQDINLSAEALESTMVMPKIVNSFSVEDVIDKPSPSFVRIEGSNGTTPPPVMIINKADTQSILFRVTQLEDDSSPFVDSYYIIRQVYLDGSKFHCVNLNPAKFTQWLISVSEVEIKLFDVVTTTQELIKGLFQAGLELFRLNTTQKATFQMFKDPNLAKYINGLYINLEEFEKVYAAIKMVVSSKDSVSDSNIMTSLEQ